MLYIIVIFTFVVLYYILRVKKLSNIDFIFLFSILSISLYKLYSIEDFTANKLFIKVDNLTSFVNNTYQQLKKPKI